MASKGCVMSLGSHHIGNATRSAHRMALAVAAHRLRPLPGLQLAPGRVRWLQAPPRWAERAQAPPQRCCSPAPPPCLQ